MFNERLRDRAQRTTLQRDNSDESSATTGLQNPGSVLAATGTGSIYAGAPRTFVAGMRLAFR